jgi:hypothetical protein
VLSLGVAAKRLTAVGSLGKFDAVITLEKNTKAYISKNTENIFVIGEVASLIVFKACDKLFYVKWLLGSICKIIILLKPTENSHQTP